MIVSSGRFMAGITLVVANGNWPQSDLVETLLEMSDFTIALDGAADKFIEWDIVIGDMDSISNPEEQKADLNQENTDLAKALQEFDVAAVVGIDGGRLDHRLGVFSALFETGSDAILYFEGWRACRVDKSGLEIELKKGTTCSIMPFGFVNKITLEGTEYELTKQDLQTSTKGVGNTSVSELVTVSHEGGDLLFIWEANEP